jgi:hypothetical protein
MKIPFIVTFMYIILPIVSFIITGIMLKYVKRVGDNE